MFDEGETGYPHLTLTRSVVEHGLWCVSRLLFVGGIVGIAFWIKIPLEEVIQINKEKQIEAKLHNDEVKKIESRNTILAAANDAEVHFDNLFSERQRSAVNPIARLDPERLTRAAALSRNAYERLNNAFVNREARLDESAAEPNFEILVRKYIDVLEDELHPSKDLAGAGQADVRDYSAVRLELHLLMSAMSDRDNELRRQARFSTETK